MLFRSVSNPASLSAALSPNHHRLRFAYREACYSLTGSVLELGCGTGLGIDLLQLNTHHYTGIDEDRQAIAILRANYHGANFIAASLSRLGYLSADRFDNVVCFRCLGNQRNDSLLVREAYRVLRPGGRLFVTVPNAALLMPTPWQRRAYDAPTLARLLQPFATVEQHGIHFTGHTLSHWGHPAARLRQLDVLGLRRWVPRFLQQALHRAFSRHQPRQRGHSSAGTNSIDHTSFTLGTACASLDLYFVATK